MDLLFYWQCTGGYGNVVSMYQHALEAHEISGASNQEMVRLMHKVAIFLHRAGETETAQQILVWEYIVCRYTMLCMHVDECKVCILQGCVCVCLSRRFTKQDLKTFCFSSTQVDAITLEEDRLEGRLESMASLTLTMTEFLSSLSRQQAEHMEPSLIAEPEYRYVYTRRYA